MPTIAANRNYSDFLLSKLVTVPASGLEVAHDRINPTLFGFQKDAVETALARGRYALFEECGMGKTRQELEWSKLVYEETGKRVLNVSPLAVASQTIEEGQAIGIDVAYCRSQEEAERADTPLIITNYEMLEKFDPAKFSGVVLDESSVLKNFMGATKTLLIRMFANTPYRLAATATPAPNDHLELGNHAEFLGIMPSNEMIARWFVNDTMHAGHYRLKGHAQKEFWSWVTDWAMCISKPSDLGYSDEGFELPPLEYFQHLVAVDHTASWEKQITDLDQKKKTNLGKTNFGQIEMFAPANSSAMSLWTNKADTLEARCNRVLEILETDKANPWIVWVDMDIEGNYLRKMLPEAIEVKGSDKLEEKERKLHAFTKGQERIIITKTKIAGFGLNWQHCNQMVYAGADFSYEKLHQSVRRSWRFGQKRPVNVHLILAETDNNLLAALNRKQEAFAEMQARMNEAMRLKVRGGLKNGQIALTDYYPELPLELPEWVYSHSENDLITTVEDY
jgi:hypothetical protein